MISTFKKITAVATLAMTLATASSALAFGHGYGHNFDDMHRDRAAIRMEHHRHKVMSRIRHRKQVQRHIMREHMRRNMW